MSKFKQLVVVLLLSVSIFILDGVLSEWVTAFLPQPFMVTSQLMLVWLLLLAQIEVKWTLYTLFFIVGIAHDVLYFHTLGIACFIYPFLVFLVKKHQGLISMAFPRFLMMIVLVFLFSSLSYALGYFYGMTSLPIPEFITFNMMPNLVYHIILTPLLKGFFKGL